MIKVLKYLKKFKISLIFVIALLFIQAQCELSLPDYMSNIVNTGIQSGGVDSSVFEAVGEENFNRVQIFMEDKDKETLKSSYNLITSADATSEQIEDYPILKTSNVYELKKLSDEEFDHLNKILPKPELIVMALESGKYGADDALSHLPEGTDVFAMLSQMPIEELKKMESAIDSKMESMGDSTLVTASTNFVKSEYAKLGMDLEGIQKNYVTSAGVKMLLISLLGAICAIGVGFLSSRIAAGLARNLRFDIFEKVENFSNAEFNKFSTASLITRTTNDIQQIQMVLVMMLRIVIYAPIMGIGALIHVLDSNASMTWIIFFVIVLLLSVIGVAFSIVMPKFKIAQQLLDKLNLVMREFLEGMPVIRAFNTEKYEEQKFNKANKDITDTNIFVNRVMAALMPVMMFIMNCVSLVIIWVGGQQIDLGTLQIGDLIAFIQYAMQIIMSFLMISMVAIMIPRAGVAANRIMEVLNSNPSILDPKNAEDFNENLHGVVEFKNVCFKYPGAEENILDNINFIAKPGQTTAFIGSTGSGKSTLINLVPRFFDVTDGEVIVDGTNIKDVTQHQLREKIGYVPQKGILFSGTIETNLLYAKHDATRQELESAAIIAQASDFIESTDDKYETAISQGGTNVSGGQKQRISIARAIVKEPEILIFDDSFSALDFKTDAKLRKALDEFTQRTQSTVLLVAQRISSIMHAEQIIVLDNGKIVGKGNHKELLNSCEVYQEIAYSQLSKEELENESNEN
ncbi:MAG: ABC transporter ATP-binding protein [Erysipelotrichaceae bacterium]